MAEQQPAGPDGSGRGEDEKAVCDVFESYREALSGKDGARAAELVSDRTLSYYGNMKQAALHMPADSARKLALQDRLLLLFLRQRLSAEELRERTGREIFVRAVDEGWIGNAQTLELYGAHIGEDFAQLEVYDRDGTLYPLECFKERGEWKLDLMFVSKLAGKGLSQQIGGEQEDERLLTLVEAASGQKTTADIWEPPAQVR